MYSNTNGFIVILDDDRNADTSWRNHLARGSAGGVDCVAPMRTPLYAPMDCIVSSYWGGTGGRTIRMAEVDSSRRPTGWVDEFMHTDEAPVTGFVPAGRFVGYSGDSGGDYAAHVHWHRIDPGGKRRNPWHYFISSPSGGGYTEIGDDDMLTPESQAWLNGMGQSIKDEVRFEIKRAQGAIQADLNYMHQVSPYSLKEIRKAQADGQPISLTKEQVDELGNQLVLSVPAVLQVALDENEAAVLAAITKLPAEFLSSLKKAL